MINNSRLLGVLLAFFLFVASVFALSTQSQPSPEAKPDYSKQAAVVENLSVVVRLNNDGTMTRETQARIRVQSDAGVQAYGLLEFPYDRSTQRLTIQYVKVLKPDGKVVVTPVTNIQDVTSPITRAAPMYSDYRQKHVAVAGLDAGDVVEYATLVTVAKPLVPGQFWFEFDFLKSQIALHESLQVSAPKDRKVIVRSPGLKSQVSLQGNRRVYLWKTANLSVKSSPAPRFGQLPPSAVEISSFASWAQVGKWWGRLERQEAKPTPDVRAEALALTKNATTDAQKVAAIYKYVSEQFRYISISFGIGRYRPHSAAEVLNNQYGDCKDKATLLAALLQAVGIKAYPALISAANKLDPQVPSPGQFDHVINYVPLGGKVLWLDTTTEVAPEGLLMPSLLAKQALVIPGNRPAFLARTPSAPPFQSFVKFDAEGKLSSDGTFTGTIQRTARGYAGVVLRAIFRKTSQSKWQQVAQGISYLLGFGGKVSNLSVSPPDDLDHPFHYSYTYVRKNYGDWAHHRIPDALPPFGMPAVKKKKNASVPIDFGAPTNFAFTSKIELPKGFVPALPDPVDLKSDFADYHSSYTFKNGVLTVERDLSVKVREIPAAGRAGYRKFQKGVSSDETQLIDLNTGTWAPVHAINPDAAKLYIQAVKAYRARNFGNARDLIQRALDLDPKYESAWFLEGSIHTAQREYENAISDLREATTLNPADPSPYRMMAQIFMHQGKRKQAIQVWRDLLKQKPHDSTAHYTLGALLLAEKQYSEAAPELEAAVAAGFGSSGTELKLARAYMGMGDAAKAADAYKKAAAVDPSPTTWETVARGLAKSSSTLAEAQHYAEQAVKADEAKSAKIDIKTAGDPEFRLMSNLAAAWGLLGGIDLKENQLAAATRYLQAAWDLSQQSDYADRLGHVYEKLGHKQEAVRMYTEAIKAGGGHNADADSRLAHLLSKRAYEIKLARTKANIETSQNGRVELGRISKATGSADFLVLFAPGPKVEGWKYVDGDPHFKALGSVLTRARFPVVFPDSAPAKILRRGALVCIGTTYGCDFTLEPLEAPQTWPPSP